MNSQYQPKIVSMFQQDQELVTKEIHEVQKSKNKILVSRKRSATLKNEIVKKFINYWKPSATFFIDSEIWPNVIFNLKLNRIPTILINGRITENSFKRWMKFENFSKSIFSNLTVCLSSNKKTVYYLRKLGAKNIKYFGNLKYAQSENEKVILEKIDEDGLISVKILNDQLSESKRISINDFQ